MTGQAFVLARLARLWSVLIPAIALTVVCDAVGSHWGLYPGAYGNVPFDLPLIRIGAILFFIAESWVSIQPFSNGVVWSLCVEFWYYMLFAAWVFVPPGRMRKAGIAAAALLAGFKAILLLPIWLMGLAILRADSRRALPIAADLALFLCGLAGTAWILATDAGFSAAMMMKASLSPWLYNHLAQARAFWFDWILGVLVTMHLLGARRVMEFVPIERCARPIRWCSGVSFAAYLFHMPLLHLTAAFLPTDQGWLAIGLTLLVIGLLGPPAERSKHWWRRLLGRGCDRVGLFGVRRIA